MEEKQMDANVIKEEFLKGYDCSQVVLRHFAKELGISEDEANRIAAGFGGGMSLGKVCGAYTGALMAIGLKYGHSNPEGLMAQKEIMTAKNMELKGRFTNEFGTVDCKELIGFDVSTPDGLQGALDSGKLVDYCPVLAGKVIKITEEILKDEER
jgi:C_GCAxxG_C_C family probable redox protein